MIDVRVAELKDAHSRENNKGNAEFILSRIASLTGGVGVIYVGGQTDLEQKELYDRIDDAVCAVRSALEQGIIPGGGTALMQEAHRLSFLNDDMTVAQQILANALRAPMFQIWENAGIKYEGQYEASLIEYNDGGKRLGFGEPARVRSLVTVDWRLTIYRDQEWGELYDLKRDSSETNNLWDSVDHQDTRAHLTNRLAHHLISQMDESPQADRLA